MADIDGDTGPNSLDGGADSDSIRGFAGNDTITGKEGSDYLYGDTGSDRYVFNVGDGEDYIYEYDAGAANNGVAEDTDVIVFGAGISADSVTVRRTYYGDIELSINGTDDRVVIYGFGSLENQVEQVQFNDGTVWTIDDLLEKAIAGTEGDDTIYGTADNDSISGLDGDDNIYGRGGSDTLEGGAGNDSFSSFDGGSTTYIFNAGDGDDDISDSDLTGTNADVDTIRFGAGIDAASVTVRNTRFGDLVLTIDGSDDSITIDAFDNAANRIEQVEFSDGTTWSTADLMAKALVGSDESETIFGTENADSITGGGGDDYIVGQGGTDTLVGGTGDDRLYATAGGSTTYLFNAGDGADDIYDYAVSDPDTDVDVIQLGAGLSADAMSVRFQNGDLVISFGDGSDKITVHDAGFDEQSEIEELRFADNSVLTAAELKVLANTATEGADWLYGTEANESYDGLGGSDQIFAFAGNDTLDGSGGDDELNGDTGSDTYLYNSGDGSDRINESDDGAIDNGVNTDKDVLKLGPGITPADLTVKQDGSDLVIVVNATQETITIEGFRTSLSSQIEEIQFADGTVWTAADLLQFANTGTEGADVLTGTSGSESMTGLGGDDRITSYSGNDTLAGGLGNDTLEGGDGADTYIFNLGDGKDIIKEADYTLAIDADVLQFGAGILPANVSVHSAPTGDIVISIAGSEDSILIDRFLLNEDYQIEEVRFADGTIWTTEMLLEKAAVPTENADYLLGTTGADVIAALGGDDEVFASAGNDTLTGGTGNDTLYGAAGSDTYVFNLGDGADTISEYDQTGTNADIDVLKLGTGILPADVRARSTSGGDLVIEIGTGGDSVTIDNFHDSQGYEIEQVQFADGTILTAEQLKVLALSATEEPDYLFGTDVADSISGAGGDDVIEGNLGADVLSGDAGEDNLKGGDDNDTLYGGDDDDYLNGDKGNDALFGEAGNDILEGNDGSDTLTGGVGNDTTYGGTGSDTYVFNLGDGADRIIDSNFTYNDTDIDVLALGTGISKANVTIGSTVNGDLLLTINGTEDRIVIANARTRTEYRIEQVQFSDGTSWTAAELEAVANTPTQGFDYLLGTTGADGFDALGGDDIISTGDGNDTVTAGAGADSITGGAGSDTYVFNLGDGQDRIVEEDDYSSYAEGFADVDIIRLGDGILPGGVQVRADPEGNLILNITADDRIVVGGFFRSSHSRIEQVVFANGTTWDVDDLIAQANIPTEGDDYLPGSDNADLISGLGGNDTIIGGTGTDTLNGNDGSDQLSGNDDNDVLNGNVGTDWLKGGDGNDTLAGGENDDFLYGEEGADTYVFNLGDGDDRIQENSYLYYGQSPATDILVLGTGIAVANTRVRFEGTNLVVSFAGNSDTITLANTGGGLPPIEEVHFADGTIWDADQLLALANTPTEGDDYLFGNDEANTISGLGGDDNIAAGRGNDVLAGGVGDDDLRGGFGDDTYLFNLGDGADWISESSYYGAGDEADRIVFGAGITTENVTLKYVDGDLLISVDGTEDSVRVSQYTFDTRFQVETLEFADGTTWGIDDIRQRANVPTPENDYIVGSDLAETLTGLGGDDSIQGSDGDDVIEGGEGNDRLGGEQGDDTVSGGIGDDTLSGGSGADTYLFNAGDGHDSVYDYGGDGDIDTVLLGDGILAENLTVRGTGSQGILITFNGTSDSLILGRMLSEDGGFIDRIRFADGTEWTGEEIIAKATTASDLDDWLYGTDEADSLSGLGGNDTIRTYDGDDTLTGGTGNDSLEGGDDADTYIFNIGDGADTIRETTSYSYYSYGDPVPQDVIQFGEGITAADVGVYTTIFGDLVISIVGTEDSITISEAMKRNGSTIERVQFADGTVWDSEQLLSRLLPGPGDDYVVGTEEGEELQGLGGDDIISANGGGDTLIGGEGDDELRGGEGNDTYVFNLGDGNDFISGYSSFSEEPQSDVIVFGDGIVSDDLTFVSGFFGQLIIGIKGTDDAISISNFFGNAVSPISELKFSDGTSLTAADVRAIAMTPTSGDDTFTGSGLDDTLTGAGGDDVLDGNDGDDRLNGGKGDDALNGGRGSDTYVFDLGDGKDFIRDYDSGVSYSNPLNIDKDILIFGEGIDKSDIRIRGGVTGDIIMLIGDGGDRIVINDFMSGLKNQIEEVRFADGSTWDADDIEDIAAASGSTNSAPTDIKLSAATIAEIPQGTGVLPIIGALTATDADVDEYFTFSLPDGDTAGGAFAIDDHNNLVVLDPSKIDFETNPTIDVLVRVTDAFGKSYEETMTITVTNVAEAPTDITLTGTTIAENAAAGTVIGEIGGIDPDANDALSFTLAGDDAAAFKIVDGKLVVADAASFDFETKSSYSITLKVEDSGGLTYSEGFIIAVTDLNEAPSKIDLTPKTIAEGSATGTIVGSVVGTDADAGDTLTYELLEGADGRFTLDEDNNIVFSAATAIDFETTAAFTVTVQATDSAGATYQEDIVIAVTNVNETPTGVTLSATTLSEAADAGDAVGTLDAVDPDVDDTFTYTLTDDAAGTFAIVGDQLVLADGATVDFETQAEYSVTVLATDSGGLTSEQTFVIAITDANEPIVGDGKANKLKGTSGEDFLVGLGGNDILEGLGGADELDGGTGKDTASYASSKKSVVANLLDAGKNKGDAAGDTYIGIENLLGSKRNDKLIGDNKANELDGGKGNDILTGNGKSDVFVFGAKYGKDTITDFAFKGGKHDEIDLSDAAGIANFKDLMKDHVKEVGDNLQITASDKSVLLLLDVDKNDIGKDHFLF
jgi:Ca2+-binding RTX toxin-like protein